MRVEIGRFGVWRMVSTVEPELATQLESLGYGAIWLGGSPKGDLRDVGRLLDATQRLTVATGIVNMWRDHADEVGASYRRVVERHPVRFLLGVGVGHREATQEFERPMAKVIAYLDELDGAGVPRDHVVLAALGPRALSVAAQRTAGAHPYLTTPRHTEFARRVMGDGPLLAPEQKVIVDTDPEHARLAGRAIVNRYLSRVNYRNNLLREGWSEEDLVDGGSDRLVDALVLHGTVAEVAAGLVAHLEAGADHVAIHALGDDPLLTYRDLAQVLIR